MATGRVNGDSNGDIPTSDMCPAKIATQDPPLLQPATSSEGPSFASESSNGVLEEEAGIRRMQGTSGKNASAAATAIAIEKYQQQLLDYDDEEEEDDEEGMTVGGYASSPKEGKEFRRRRLTFATQHKMSSNVSPPEVQSLADDGLMTDLVQQTTASTMTIYRALELGEEDSRQTAPFPASILGIYSCHGAEPGWEHGEEDFAKINQDRACVVYPYLGSKTCALLCVYDGHGERGDMVSNFAMNEIPTRLARHPRVMEDPEVALRETFEEVDRALPEAAVADEQVYSGTTAVVALYRDGHVWVANAGDSRAVLGAMVEREGKAVSGEEEEGEVAPALVPVALSIDHNPDRPGELERIESCGGFVSPPPEEGLSARVWLDEEMTRIGLAMARSIGDHAVKAAGVIATPEVTVRKVMERDAFIVLASDGVWEFMKNREVVELVHNRLQKTHNPGQEAADACAEVISVAAARWRQFEGAYRDDISCLVLRLPCFQGDDGGSVPAGASESVPGVGVINPETLVRSDGGLRSAPA